MKYRSEKVLTSGVSWNCEACGCSGTIDPGISTGRPFLVRLIVEHGLASGTRCGADLFVCGSGNVTIKER